MNDTDSAQNFRPRAPIVYGLSLNMIFFSSKYFFSVKPKGITHGHYFKANE